MPSSLVFDQGVGRRSLVKMLKQLKIDHQRVQSSTGGRKRKLRATLTLTGHEDEGPIDGNLARLLPGGENKNTRTLNYLSGREVEKIFHQLEGLILRNSDGRIFHRPRASR